MMQTNWIWRYAKAMGKSVGQIAPDDMVIRCDGTKAVRVEGTMRTVYEMEALIMAIRILGKTLTSHRVMLRGDIYPATPMPTFREALANTLGDYELLQEMQDG